MATFEALDRLFIRTNAGIKPGTEAIVALLDALGNPQSEFLSVHVAGTNGKGSVSAILESILRAAGLKTGLYTSPHLVHFNERFKISGHPVSDAFLEELIERVEVADEHAAKSERPGTFFELSTAIAFSAFADIQAQVAVIETGLGGRWDATNVINPLVSVITPIAYDHTEFLGDSLKAIAGEKAGIIKPGRPVVIADQPDAQVRDVLAAEAEACEAPVIWQDQAISLARSKQDINGQTLLVETVNESYGTCRLPLLGEHQVQNLGTAVLAAEAVFQQLGLDLEPEAVKQGITSVAWPGRCEVLRRDPPLLVDGAHNPAGASSLLSTLEALFPGKKGAFVFGFLSDKDPVAMIDILAERVGFAVATAVDSPRAICAEDTRNLLNTCQIKAEACSLEESIARAVAWAEANDSFVCITGSLYLVGAALEWHDEQEEQE